MARPAIPKTRLCGPFPLKRLNMKDTSSFWSVGETEAIPGSGSILCVWQRSTSPGQNGTPVCFICPVSEARKKDQRIALCIANLPPLFRICAEIVEPYLDKDEASDKLFLENMPGFSPKIIELFNLLVTCHQA